ncbi:hypothetical protein MSG28_014681 [Choristoneura fumiferana]|uniref:Uncharacterized protein n=1 Tax=Choristoneura fumiferana TaxID=7141 RepID=A0ACC0JS74_CHOFU|nr:hypothetical protein MSG28_014681 [Choristoneura fumiferana]
MLPKDFGGDDISLDKIHVFCTTYEFNRCMDGSTFERRVHHALEGDAESGTDESRRRAALDNSMFGVPGTFRALNVD